VLRGLSPQPSPSADTEAFLEGPFFLSVFPGRPDERPSDERERNDAYGGNHYPEEGVHDGIVSLREILKPKVRLSSKATSSGERFLSWASVLSPDRAG
jgi:hypothetical protein